MATGGITAAASFLLGRFIVGQESKAPATNSNTSSTAEAPSPTATLQPTVFPQAPVLAGQSGEMALQATAAAGEKSGLDHTFIPEGGFTTEMFERVRRSTFCVNGSYTCWVAEANDYEVYLVTNEHCVDLESPSLSLKLQRTTNDGGEEFLLPVHSIATNAAIDQAVIKIVLPTDGSLRSKFQVLHFLDNIRPPVPTNVLTVGYPGPFMSSAKSPLTYGEVSTIREYEDTVVTDRDGSSKTYYDSLRIPGISYAGMSGSPITMIVSDNDIAVIGIQNGGQGTTIVSEDRITTSTAQTLSIAPLISKLKTI